MSIKYKLLAAWITATAPLRRTHTANVCGHKTKRYGFMQCLGETSVMRMPLQDNGQPDYCLDCVGKMGIRCTWCGGLITIGSPVTLLVPLKSFAVPEYAVRHIENGVTSFVGCLSSRCADVFDICGYWVPPGKVMRVPSPIELCLGTGDVVLVGDVSNYPASVSVHQIH